MVRPPSGLEVGHVPIVTAQEMVFQGVEEEEGGEEGSALSALVYA